MYRVMLADDSDATQRIFSLAFKDSDYDLIRANDGVDALEYISHSPVDLVLADVGLPVIDGYQLCEALQKDNLTSSIPVILMGSIRFPIDKERIQGIGCSGILEKPFETSQLENLVRELLEVGRGAEGATPVADLSGTPGTLSDAIVESICSESVPRPELIPGLEMRDLEARTRVLPRSYLQDEEEPLEPSSETSSNSLSEADYLQVADLVLDRISGTLRTVIPEAVMEVLDRKKQT